MSFEEQRHNSHPVTVPITFNTLPAFVDRVWNTMQVFSTNFQILVSDTNKAIFKKGMLILAEAKVCIAQRNNLDCTNEELPSRNLYSLDELKNLQALATTLPFSLVMYLDCIGNTMDGKQRVIPVLAEFANEEMKKVSGAITYGPRHLIPLLRILRTGVARHSEMHKLAMTLDSLPGMKWEEFAVPLMGSECGEKIAMIRITKESYKFWLEGELTKEIICWSHRENIIFRSLIAKLDSLNGFNVPCDLSRGQGTMAQTVQVPEWKINVPCKWYTMSDVEGCDQKWGIAFGFGYTKGHQVQPSRFRSSYTMAYWRGQVIPRRILNSLIPTLVDA